MRLLLETDIIDMTNRHGKKTGQKSHSMDTRPLDDLLGFHTRLAAMQIRRSYLANVGNGEIRPGIASLLLLVAANAGASQTDVSRAMHVDKASLVAMLDKAEASGWLQRIRSSEDRRRHELSLTDAGQEMATSLRRQISLHQKKFVDRFTPGELATLVELLRRIYD